MSALTFHDTQITIIDRGGTPWIPGPEIGAALGYEVPAAAIRKIFERNRLEFTEEMSMRVKMGRLGNLVSETRVFTPRGALLLAMHANTERAVAFRAWVLDILEGKTPLPGQVDRAAILTDALLQARPRWERHLFYDRAGLTHGEVARIEGVSRSAVSMDAKELRRLGLLTGPARRPVGKGRIAQDRRAVLIGEAAR
ncbi:MAG: Bro-N domain-containing protein [Pseudomonadota bacterium]